MNGGGVELLRCFFFDAFDAVALPLQCRFDLACLFFVADRHLLNLLALVFDQTRFDFRFEYGVKAPVLDRFESLDLSRKRILVLT